MIRSRRKRNERHVARIEKKRNIYRILMRNLKQRCHLEDLGVCGRIILKWI
jgi:hypothetical protein